MDHGTGTARQTRLMRSGLDAAVDVARGLGFGAGEPVLIQETNNTVVWLAPHPVIAKVATRAESAEDLIREHQVATALDRLGAPVGAPVKGFSPIQHQSTGFVVTLWQRLPHDPDAEASAREVGRSLSSVHEALSRCGVPLPSFQAGIERARRALADDRQISTLSQDDRTFLRDAFDALMDELAVHSFEQRALHGEPHDGNYLLTDAGLRWIDFESACWGPVEWDLAFVASEACEAFPGVDRDLLQLLRTLNSAHVATWCWSRYQLPEMRWRAQRHLNVVQMWRTPR